MGSKRKHSEVEADASENGRARENPGFHAPKKSKNAKKSKAKSGSMNWIKKRARTIERRFKTGQNLPANIRIDLERELAHHQEKLAEVADEKKRKNMISKYHMVRFFERKKADRLAKQIQSQIDKSKDAGEIEKLKADLHKAEVDSLYTKFFPYRQRYASLYPVASLGLSVQGGEKPEDASTAAQALHTDRPPLWEAIEKAAEQGIPALVAIRERKSSQNSKNTKHDDQSSKDATSPKSKHTKGKSSDKSESANTKKGKSKTRQNKPSDSNDGSDSDGGFFEED
ncbi:hypothetical protein F4819DRAFT_174957 [Hypoxylon fuscum]|nr:hypothetical protein F4819DRAFT_174957 [Hypoxylon fuscum]